jgi:hypothetical protein
MVDKASITRLTRRFKLDIGKVGGSTPYVPIQPAQPQPEQKQQSENQQIPAPNPTDKVTSKTITPNVQPAPKQSPEEARESYAQKGDENVNPDAFDRYV